jgi:hypothetical protein
MPCPRHSVQFDQAEHFTERLEGEPRAWLDHQSRTENRIEHPARHHELGPVLKLDNELLPASTTKTLHNTCRLIEIRMVSITDRHRGRGMSSVLRPCATAMPPISWKRESTPARSKLCWVIIGSGPRLSTRTSPWRDCDRWSARSTVCPRRRVHRPAPDLRSTRAAVWSRVPEPLAPVPPCAADATRPGALPHGRPGRSRHPVRSLQRGTVPLSFLRQPKLSPVRWEQAGSLAGQMSGRPPARALLPRRLHLAPRA